MAAVTQKPDAHKFMNDELHEVEAYVHTDDAMSIVAQLECVIGKLEEEDCPDLELRILTRGNTTIVIQPSEGGFIGALVMSTNRYWPSSPALGRFLASRLRCRVRCDPEDEYPNVSPYSDEFLEIQGDTESIIIWD